MTLDPTAPGSPTPTTVGSGEFLHWVACPSVNQCTTVDSSGQQVTFDPTAPGSPTPTPTPFAGANTLKAIACSSVQQCATVDSVGNGFVRGPGSCRALSPTAANFTPKHKLPGRRVPGVRARISVTESSQQMIHAVLSFGRRGHRRSVVLGDRTLGNPGRRNLRLPLPLPAALRDRLLLGSKVRLELQITSTPDSAPDCRGPATTVLKLRTRVVRVLAALQSRAG